ETSWWRSEKNHCREARRGQAPCLVTTPAAGVAIQVLDVGHADPRCCLITPLDVKHIMPGARHKRGVLIEYLTTRRALLGPMHYFAGHRQALSATMAGGTRLLAGFAR
ncbi:MAG: hypothetical protein WA970_10210, partial [Gammaproteobacteria bacterium]